MKKTIKILFLVLSVVALLALSHLVYTYSKIDDALIEYRIYSQSEKIQKIIKNYDIVQCRHSIFKPKYSIVAHKYYSEDRQTYDVAFYSPIRHNILSSSWQIDYTGGTTVKNTTFDELVAMVKDDCNQFQEAKGDPSDEVINWSYSPYIPEKEEEPEEELSNEEIEELRQQYKLEREWYLEVKNQNK